ncbi:MAG: hypothetical protein E7544_07005 [Ruminococcaceae bacterium]|nr:hypothetical protein [Oscillospiraceae bacterium]
MNAFISQILSFILAIVSSMSMAFTPITEEIVKSNFDYATSFDQVVYEEQLVPTEDEDGWVFTTDRDIKVVQLTDIHIGGGSMSKDKDRKAMNAVAAMLTYEKPDLVILTGDMVYPVPFQAGTFNNSISTEMLITLLEKLGVYYAPVFGNHDSEAYSTHSREEIADMWGADDLNYSLFKKGPEDVDGVGNYIIKVKGTDGKVKNAFFLLDSNEYLDNDPMGLLGNYDRIHDNQIEWYRSRVEAIDAANDDGDAIFSSCVFFHIPLQEYDIAWKEFAANGYQDTENVKYISGGYHEPDEAVCCSTESENFFETMLELGSTKGVFVGHDHVNNAILNYKGINLVYGMSIDYLAYVNPVTNNIGPQRGCTVISLTQDGELSVSLENYYQEKYVSKYEKESVSMDW